MPPEGSGRGRFINKARGDNGVDLGRQKRVGGLLLLVRVEG